MRIKIWYKWRKCESCGDGKDDVAMRIKIWYKWRKCESCGGGRDGEMAYSKIFTLVDKGNSQACPQENDSVPNP